jgi:hypothetical protein
MCGASTWKGIGEDWSIYSNSSGHLRTCWWVVLIYIRALFRSLFEWYCTVKEKMLAVNISRRWTQEIIFLVSFCSSTVRFSMEALNWCWSRCYWCWLPWSSWSHPLQSLWHWFHHPSRRPHCTTNPSAHHHTTSLGSGGPGYNHSWWRWLWVHWHCGLGCRSLNLLVIQQFPSKHQDKEDMTSNSFAISWEKIRNALLLLMIDGDYYSLPSSSFILLVLKVQNLG